MFERSPTLFVQTVSDFVGDSSHQFSRSRTQVCQPRQLIRLLHCLHGHYYLVVRSEPNLVAVNQALLFGRAAICTSCCPSNIRSLSVLVFSFSPQSRSASSFRRNNSVAAQLSRASGGRYGVETSRPTKYCCGVETPCITRFAGCGVCQLRLLCMHRLSPAINATKKLET